MNDDFLKLWTVIAAIATTLAAAANFFLAYLTWRSVKASEMQAERAKEQSQFAKEQTELALSQARQLQMEINAAYRPLIISSVLFGSDQKLDIRVTNLSKYSLVYMGCQIRRMEADRTIIGIHPSQARVMIEEPDSRLLLPEQERLLLSLDDSHITLPLDMHERLFYAVQFQYLSNERAFYTWEFEIISGIGPIPFVSSDELVKITAATPEPAPQSPE